MLPLPFHDLSTADWVLSKQLESGWVVASFPPCGPNSSAINYGLSLPHFLPFVFIRLG